jgi:hypothetical protein
MTGLSRILKSYDHAMYGSAVVINLGSLRFGIRVVKGVVALYVSPRGRGWPLAIDSKQAAEQWLRCIRLSANPHTQLTMSLQG